MKILDYKFFLNDTLPLNYQLDLENLYKSPLISDEIFLPYNPRKPNIARFGASLTSLSGDSSGVPDLDSLKEYNAINGTSYKESSFKTKTSLLRKLPEVENFTDLFGSDLSRSHILKFNTGGFFPPHRDVYPSAFETFRLFSLISRSDISDYQFVINGSLYEFAPGRIYFINTAREHSFYSFAEDVLILILNIDLTERAANRVNSLI